MNPIDYVLIIIIAAVVIGAVYFEIRKKKNGEGCCGDCANCPKSKK